ncbi:MAG TPA: MarR family transcriptional regulator [Polyangiales bacterium]|nr:MarR family transcriptional regulator [Polyangiales bacterium]
MSRVSESTRQALEVRKRASVLQLLFKCARLANERAMARVNEQAARPVLKGAHTALLPHLTYEGVRVVELARKLEISKQAVSQTLAEMADAGVVELTPDPSDGRAKLARLTSSGAASIAQGLSVLEALQRELADEIGDAKMRTLHDALLSLEQALGSGA